MFRPSARPLSARGRTGRGARRQGVVRARAPKTRGKRTFYRYRRGAAPVVRRILLVVAAVAVAWWLGLSLRHNQPVRQVAPPPDHILPAFRPHVPIATPPPPLSLTLDGAPSIDAARVDGILAAYGSPLEGHGNDIVALSRRYGVDDAVALAFFVMESRAGTQGEAVLTHSFGNLRPMAGAPSRDGYRSYKSWLDSASEWFRVMRSLYLDGLHLHTVEDVIPVYAPATDSNDPPTMIAGIHQLVSCWRGAVDACPADPPGVPALLTGRMR